MIENRNDYCGAENNKPVQFKNFSVVEDALTLPINIAVLDPIIVLEEFADEFKAR